MCPIGIVHTAEIDEREREVTDRETGGGGRGGILQVTQLLVMQSSEAEAHSLKT